MKPGMKQIVLVAIIAAGMLASTWAMAQRQIGDRTPTADIDQHPRKVEELNWERPGDRQHSVLDGGATGSFPVDRVELPDLCEVAPDHPSCVDGDPGGGGGGPPLPSPIDPPVPGLPVLPTGCDCPGMAVLPGGFIEAIRQFRTLQECEAARPNYPGVLECSSYTLSPGAYCASLHVHRSVALLETHCRSI